MKSDPTHPAPSIRTLKSVLVVDDNPNTAAILAVLLGIVNFDVTLATSASDALALAGRGGFDLILINPRLRDHSSGQLCRQIREFDRRTPVLFYSSEARNVTMKADWVPAYEQKMALLSASTH